MAKIKLYDNPYQTEKWEAEMQKNYEDNSVHSGIICIGFFLFFVGVLYLIIKLEFGS